MNKILFVDRDGTLIYEPEDYQIDSLDKLEFYPEVFTYLSKIAKELDYEIVMVTNQDGLGTEGFPETDFWPIQNFIIKTFKNEGVEYSDVLIDRTFAKDNASTRKPNTGLLEGKFIGNSDYDLKNSFMVGDRLTDIEFAVNFGGKGIFIDTHEALGADEVKNDKSEVEKNIALNAFILQLILVIKKIIINPINVLRKAARSPDKKIITMLKKIVTILILLKFELLLKYNASPINKKSILDK